MTGRTVNPVTVADTYTVNIGIGRIEERERERERERGIFIVWIR